MRPVPKGFVCYKYVISLLGLLVFCWAAIHSGSELERHLPELFVFSIIILLGEFMPIIIPGTNIDVTVTFPAVISLFLSHGPYAALTIASISTFIGVLVVHRKRNLKWLLDMSSYNTALCTLPTAVACWVYLSVGGRTLQGGQDVALSSMIVPLFVCITASTTAHVLVFMTGMALHNRDPWRLAAAQSVGLWVPNYIVTAPSGILFAHLYKQFGVYGVLLIIIPFIVGRQVLHMYSEQVDTYRDTVTTLGSYMQHYHPYTKGHLERVADLSDRIARHMALSYQSLMFIREAGLLHDIGKVGV
ncbi:MAG: hypothetical protein NTU88_01350, partial [Armatimonadetes bacterium]|nr:hypothetical protein [Armatimonadota bacterium]